MGMGHAFLCYMTSIPKHVTTTTRGLGDVLCIPHSHTQTDSGTSEHPLPSYIQLKCMRSSGPR